MSYGHIRKTLEEQAKDFRGDVLAYLEQTGRAKKGRSYFGVLAANNPNLVRRLENGELPGLEVMIRVREYMENNPPDGSGLEADSDV
ncbi:hypothetical protein [Tritonibacter mobilis]|uniref:hypothetical protein n=1 Tax=Tritonibacter mobilis TaxID=379347 RepID=UPI001C09A788|nr:hypothetical protein [Tritonibacter mobilis]MBU3035958.1 hypothetical protein [Tritonibacter mobilis]WHQ85327.1 hypothetical protein OMR53_21860 [Tritonibacter mobilis]